MRRHSLIRLMFLAVLVSGCATQRGWVYAANPYRDVPPLSNKKAVVLPFDDMRQNANDNWIALYLIPLMPFGWMDLNVPEGMQGHVTSGLWTNYKPTEDYAKALAAELQNARAFNEAYFDFKRGDADFVVSGKILTTMYKGKIISYGLSAYGPLLWLFGLPSGTLSNDLSVELSVTDAKSSKTVFTKVYAAPPYEKTAWIYSLPSDFNYPDMLKGIYSVFLEDLKAQAATIANATKAGDQARVSARPLSAAPVTPLGSSTPAR